jgi:hypothetical protein
MSSVPPPGGPEQRRPLPRAAPSYAARLGSGSVSGLLGKLLCFGVVNGGTLYAVMTQLPLRAATPLLVVLVATIALDVVSSPSARCR